MRVRGSSIVAFAVAAGAVLCAQAAQPIGCIIEPDEVAEVGSPVIGVIQSILVQRGDTVRRGQVIAILRNDVERASLELARSRAAADAEEKAALASYDFARQRLARTVELHGKQFISKQALDQAEAEARVAEHKLAQAREQQRALGRESALASAQLEERTIRSPIDGVIAERYLAAGERVEEKALVRVAKIDPLRVEVILPSAMFGALAEGASARIVPEMPGAAPLAAKVVLVDKVLDAPSNTFRVRLRLPNPKGVIPAGVRCKAEFPGLEVAAEEHARGHSLMRRFSSPVVEECEPRLLYSADLAPDGLALVATPQVVEQRMLNADGDFETVSLNQQANAPRSLELVIVDAAIDRKQLLLAGIDEAAPQKRIEVVVLDPERDGIDQISAALAGRQDISAVHIVSHGASGELRLGSTRVDLDQLAARGGQITAWSNALTETGDILLYGCDVAADAPGEAFVRQLAVLTRADVAASSDRSGNAALGGDWNLEFVSGAIEAGLALTSQSQAAWMGVLANPVLSGANNLSAINEDATGNSGTLVSALIAGKVTDPDAGALSGIAVTGVNNTNGTWEYSTDGGTVWNAFGAPSSTSARLLAADADNRVRFVPNPDFNGTVAAGLTFRAWDQTSGSDGATININTTTATVRDEFNAVAYNNNNGTTGSNWSTSWTEVGDDGSASSGTFKVSGGQLVTTPTLLTANSIFREANLAGATSATLSLSYNNSLALLGSVNLQVSNGGAPTTLATFSAGSNTGSGTLSFDISAFIGTGTRITLSVPSVLSIGGSLAVDNVQILYGPASFSSASASSSITVTAVNDAPVNTAPAAQSVNEDATLVFSTGNGNAISIADLDAGVNPVQVSLSVTNGTLSLNGSAGLAFTTGDGSADASMVFTGTISNINAALNGLAFTPTLNFNGAALLSLATNDQGNSGSGGALTDSDSVSISVNAVNDAPLNAVPGAQTVNEDAVLVFSSGNANAISIADLDAGVNPVQVSLSVTNGTLSLNGTAGLAFSTGDGTADASMVFTGTVSNINAALNGLAFAPTADFNGAALLSLATNDQGNSGSGGPLTDSDSVSISVNAVNDAPLNTVPGAQSVNEDATLVFSTGNGNAISIADLDAGANPVQVSLSVGNGTLSLNGTAGLAFSTGDGTADASMVFTGTLSNINAALNGLAFTPTLNFNGAALLSLATNDQGNSGSGAPLTDSDSVSVSVNAVNDAPVNTVPAAQSVNEDATLVFSTGNGNAISIADLDARVNPVQVSLSVTNGTLSLNGSAGLAFTTGDGSADASMVFTGTISNINAALNGLAFAPTADFNGAALLSLATSDQGNSGSGGALTDSDSVSISVSAANDAPVNTVPGAQGTNVNVPLVFSAANANPVSVGDIDVGASALEVTLTVTNGTLTLGGTTGLAFSSGDGTADASMTFTGMQADINAALDGLTYTPTAAFSGTASMQIIASDLGSTGSGGTQTDTDNVSIEVNAVNDAPVNTVPAAQTVNEDTVLVFSAGNGNAVSVADPDGDPLQITLGVSNGTLSLSGTTGLVFTTGDGSADASMVFTGTILDINAALNGLAFAPTADFNGPATFGLDASDGSLTDSDTVGITIAPVADTPSVTNAATNEDTQTAAGLVMTRNAADGVEVTHFKISGITGGTLYLNDGTTVISDGSFITAADGAAGLKFTPAPDSTASGGFLVRASLTSNDAGLGGAAVAASITVNAVNDAPSFTLGASPVLNEDAPAQSVPGFANGSPAGGADEAAQTLAYTVTNDNNALFAAQPTIDAAGLLSYTLTSDASGIATVSVFVTDSGGTANGGVDTSGTQNFTITVTAVNDGPVNTVPAAQAVNEDATLVFSSGNGNAISIADVDAGASSVQVSLTASNGTLSLSGTTGLTFGAGDGTADASMVFTGTISNINAALNGLAFTPTADFNGAALLSLSTNDQGNSGSGGPLTDSDSVSISVNAVNDAPLNAVPGAQTVNEDAVLVFSSGNANAISIADLDAGVNPVQVSLSVTNGTLSLNGTAGLAFSTGDGTADASMVFTGTVSNINAALNGLAFAPTADFNGAALLSLATNDQGNSGSGGPLTDSDSVSISVNAVNDAPSFGLGADPVLNEDARAQSVPGFAPASPGGGADEATQTFAYTVINDNNALFAVQPTIDAAGLLSYALTSEASGIANVSVFVTDSGGTANGGVDTSGVQTFTITVNAVNDAPTFALGPSPIVNEDAPAQSVAAFATASPGGGADESAQTFTYTVTNDNNALFSAQPTIDATGRLSYALASNAAGIASVAVFVTDSGGTANGGADTSATQRFTITVNPVNDAPSFALGTSPVVNEDAPAQSVPGFTTASPGGGADEAAQTFTYTVNNDNNALFSAQPTIDATGRLSYALTLNASGVANVSVFVTDSGGTASGGADTSGTQNFTITVNAVNDAPGFAFGAGPVVNEDAAAQSVPGFAAASPGGGGDEAAQILTYTVTNDHSVLFSSQPTIDATGRLKYTLTPNASGVANVSVFVTDSGGTGNGGMDTSGIQTFAITVNPVNDAPSFTLGASPVLNEDAPAQSTPGFAAASPGGGADEAAQTFAYILTNDNNALFSGQPTIDAAGRLSYVLTPNASGVADVTVRVIDSGGTANGGVDTSGAQGFTIMVNAVNDAPIAANRVVTVVGNASIVIGPGDLGYSDPEGDRLSSATITSLPGLGTLRLDDVPVAVNQPITAADLAAGRLRYFAPTDAGQARSAGFEFRVSDGVLDSVATYTISLSLQPAGVTLASPAAAATETLPALSSVAATSQVVAIPVEIRAQESTANARGADAADAASVLLTTNVEIASATAASAGTSSGASSGATAGAEAVESRNAALRHAAFAQEPAAIFLAQLSGLAAESRLDPLESPDVRLAAAATRNSAFTHELDRLRSSVQEEADFQQRVIASSIAVGAGVSIGYVLWLLRGGVLLASLLSSLPAWRFVDPLPVLARLGGEEDDEDDESLESIVGDDEGADLLPMEEPRDG